MLNVVVFNNYDGINTTGKHFFNMFDYFVEVGFSKIEFQEIFKKSGDEIRNLFITKFGKIPDNIIFFEHLTEMSQINIPIETKINVLIDDLHHQGNIRKNRIISISKVSRIFSTYAYSFNKFYPTTVPIYFLPHAASFDVGFNENPIDKILISGRLNKEIYPFRHAIHLLSKENSFLEYLPVNCNYIVKQDSDELIYGKRYIEKLNKYLACFTCDVSADRPYIVAKHFEIMLSGALLIAGNPNTKIYFEKLGYKDNVHYIAATMSDINEKIDFIKNPTNRPLIDIIRKNGYELTKSKHMFINIAKYVISVLENTDESIKCDDGINGGVYFMEKYD